MILPEQLSAFTFINDVKEDPDRYLWLASYKGLTCYDGHKLIHYNNKGTQDSIFLSEEGTGYLHLSTDDNGLHFWTKENETGNLICFNTKTRKIVKTIKNNKKASVIAYAGENNHGIYALEKAKEGSGIMIYSINREGMDTLFLNIEDDIYSYNMLNGVHHVTTVLQKTYKIDSENNIDSLDDNSLLSEIRTLTGLAENYKIMKIDQDEVWLNNQRHGLQIWKTEEKELEYYTDIINNLATTYAPKSLRGNLTRILKAMDGSILLLSENSLYRLKARMPSEDEFLEPIYSGKPITSMRQIAEDDKGNIYASYYTGVAVKKKGSKDFTDFRDTRTTAHAKEATYSLTYHKDVLIWNTTAYDLRTGVQSVVGIDKIGGHVNHVLEQDTLWVFAWYTNQWIKSIVPIAETTIIKDKLFDTPVLTSAIELDKYGHFWFANDRGGIKVMDRHGELVKAFSLSQLGINYKDDFLYGLHIAGDKALVGTQVALLVLDIETEETISYPIPYAGDNGQLVQRRVYSILPSGSGQFYLGTDHGLILFDPDLLTFRELAKGHPLENKEFNRNSTFKASDGRYYMGTVDGLYSFLPEELVFELQQADISKPKIYHLQVFNEKTNEYEHIISDWQEREKVKLKASDKNILLEYASPGQNTIWYSHRVLGLQEQWSAYATEGKVDIYSLPPGDFIIELKALKSPLDQTEEVTLLHIEKPQYWYLRWWAYGLYVLVLISVVAWIVRNRFQRKLDQQKELELLRTKISSDLHDDVGSILGGLAIQSELMASAVPEKFSAKMTEISAMSREAMELMRDTVWAMDPRKDKFENLFDRMRVFTEQALGRNKIDYSFYVNEIIGSRSIDPETRQHIYLIFKEAITNIVKHSDGTKVDIAIDLIEGEHLITIKDNGMSNLELNEGGQGLSNMKMRAQAIGGDLWIDRDEGFEVKLVVKNS